MNLFHADEDVLLADSAWRWLQGAAATSAHGSRWTEFAEAGWLSLPVAESAGGAGGSDASLAAFIGQLGRACCNEPYLPVVVSGAGLLGRLDGPTPKQWLAALASGEEAIVVADRPQLRATQAGNEWRLSGAQPLVLGGDVATRFLLPAYGPDQVLRLFAVARDAAGLQLDVVTCLGACNAADLRLHDVCATLLCERDVGGLLEATMDRSAAMACADAVGAMKTLVDATLEYTNSRVQFKKPLASFQVIEHYRADLLIGREEARAITQLAVLALSADPAFRRRCVSAAKVKVGEAARRIAQQSIQMHGAMGVTDELSVGLYVKRLLAFEALWGSNDFHLNRYATLVREDGIAGDYLARSRTDGNADSLALDDDLLEFQQTTRDFLRSALPAETSFAQSLTTTVYAEADVAAPWQSILHAQGWSACNWPAEHGGTGWNAERRYVWAQESAAAGVPTISPLGLPLVGPVLMHFGSPAQKHRYLPKIVSGEELWCQGFSEPGAGSDLAALSTRAVRDGDDYIVNGSKIWTTHGHVAHFMAALLRTGPAGGRREGIGFFLIDMRSPGITIRPIVTIGGDHELNQIFFDDVRVPAVQLVGGEGAGWEIAKFMLEYERGGDIMSAGHRRLLAEIRTIALQRGAEDPAAFWRSFARVAVDVDTLEMLELRTLLGCDDPAPAAASILKLRASEIQQSVTELGVALLGVDAVRWEARRPLYSLPNADGTQGLVSRYLNSRANTIFGGAREIQKTLIARSASAS